MITSNEGACACDAEEQDKIFTLIRHSGERQIFCGNLKGHARRLFTFILLRTQYAYSTVGICGSLCSRPEDEDINCHAVHVSILEELMRKLPLNQVAGTESHLLQSWQVPFH